MRFRLCLASALLAAAVPASAQDGSVIVAARQAGIVGERYDGYLGLAREADEGVRRQVGAVNIRRRSLYTGLAARRNVTVVAVGIAAGCELLSTTRVGEAYLLNDEKWRWRESGESAPAPDYCRR